MITKTDLSDNLPEFFKQALHSCGAVSFGGVPFSALAGFMSPEQLDKANSLCCGIKSVICCAFPYYVKSDGNICRYARGRDYHTEICERLAKACTELKEYYPGNNFVSLTDNSPLPETYAAVMSGIGMLGQNGLIIVPPYGSYVFIGTIATDLELNFENLPEKYEQPRVNCGSCGKCAKACPTKAFTTKDGRRIFDYTKCVSHISQKKGELSATETEALKNSKLIWGCDECLDACPYNQNPKETEIPGFRENLITSLKLSDVNGLSNREFLQKYHERSFTWRGKAVLIRNLTLKEND